MDIKAAAKFFDRQEFDHYDFATSAWVLASFVGQLKVADTFVSIWNRPTRKRMLYTAPEIVILSSVIRMSTTQEVLLVGSAQSDSFNNQVYKEVRGLHAVSETGTLQRWINDPPISRQIIEPVFFDIELRSVNENIDKDYQQNGHFFGFFQSSSTAKKHDVVIDSLNNEFFIVETYKDSGFLAARLIKMSDDRVVLTYRKETGQTYNPATQQVTPTYADFEVLGRVFPYENKDRDNSEIPTDYVSIQLDSEFVTFEIDPNDLIVNGSKSYVVSSVTEDSSLTDKNITIKAKK